MYLNLKKFTFFQCNIFQMQINMNYFDVQTISPSLCPFHLKHILPTVKSRQQKMITIAPIARPINQAGPAISSPIIPSCRNAGLTPTSRSTNSHQSIYDQSTYSSTIQSLNQGKHKKKRSKIYFLTSHFEYVYSQMKCD